MTTRSAIFSFSTHSVPAGLQELLMELGFDRSNRETAEHPLWWRANGIGYSLWCSDVALSDSSAEPPLWTFRLESLVSLPEAGARRWELCLHEIEKFLDDCGLGYNLVQHTDQEAT